MTREALWNLRMEIRLCSLFYADYQNSFGIDCHAVCDFFDGYADYLDELMQDGITGYTDARFSDHLPEYDNADNLWDWYCCFEDNPLPLPVCDASEAA